MSGLVEPSGEEQLCIYLLRDGGEKTSKEVGSQWESPEQTSKEVGCQWESPEQTSKEVGCQWERPEEETRDAAVQVDLLMQQLSWTRTGSSAVLLQCVVRPDGADAAALLQYCTPTRTRTRTRTRTIQPPVKLSPTLREARPQRRPRRQRSSPGPIHRQNRHQQRDGEGPQGEGEGRQRQGEGPPEQGEGYQQEGEEPPEQECQQEGEEPLEQECQQEGEEPPEQECQQEGEEPPEQECQQEGEEPPEQGQDAGDPTWTPHEGGRGPPGGAGRYQHAPGLKLEAASSTCDVCGKVMKNKSSLARHAFIHTGKKPFSCQLCELRFNRRDNLRHHVSRMHANDSGRRRRREAPRWLCAACGKTFSCRSRLKTHEAIHSGVKPHRCDLCPKAYMRTNDLQHHKRAVHAGGAAGPPRRSTLLCHLCGREFRCKSQLAVHLQTHTGERPHLCDVCGRKFARHHQLTRHKVLVHANRGGGPEAPPLGVLFSCHVCGKRLKSEALLAAHGRAHSAERPHRCGVCLRGFQRLACLKQHHARVHLRAKEPPPALAGEGPAQHAHAFACPLCGRSFRFRSLLASHALVHSGARPFSCDLCGRGFRRIGHLKRHREVVHADGERPPKNFVCRFCGKDKKCRSQLARHVIIHTGERPFACDLCPARFNRSGNLKQHRKRMHGVGAEPDDEAPPILFDDDDIGGADKEEVAVSGGGQGDGQGAGLSP